MKDVAPSLPALRALATRFSLSQEASERLAVLGAMLANDPSAPTTIRDPVAIGNDHLADALVALELPAVRSARAVADLGAGAGIPGLPLAIALPHAQVTLVDGNARKCEFIGHAIAVLGLNNARVANARAEAWPDGIESFDLVTARALAPLDVVAEYAAPILKLGGTLVAWRGRREVAAEAAAARAASILGLSVQEPVHVRPYENALHRNLHLMSKVAATPSRFPRRPGVARKRPLGAQQRI